MKGLLLKDLYMAVKYFRVYFLLALAVAAASFFVDGNPFYIYYPCFVCGMIPLSLQSYDEKSKWETFCQALPYTKAQVVSGKYIFGLAIQLLVILPIAASQAFRMHQSGTFSWDIYLTMMGSLVAMGFAVSAIPMPFIFRYGAEKGRMAQYLMIAIFCGGLVAASIWFGEALPAVRNFPALPLLVFLAAAGLYALSWYLSIVFYRKREV